MHPDNVGQQFSSYQPGIYEDESDMVEHHLPVSGDVFDVVDASDRYKAGAYKTSKKSFGPNDPIFATQEWVDKSVLKQHANSPSSSPIDVVEMGGHHYIMDGHHRAVANSLLGRTTHANVFHWRG